MKYRSIHARKHVSEKFMGTLIIIKCKSGPPFIFHPWKFIFCCCLKKANLCLKIFLYSLGLSVFSGLRYIPEVWTSEISFLNKSFSCLRGRQQPWKHCSFSNAPAHLKMSQMDILHFWPRWNISNYIYPSTKKQVSKYIKQQFSRHWTSDKGQRSLRDKI